MKLVCMKLFSDFECTGKYCRHNCCKTGWDIEIDKPTLDYLDSVGDCSLRSITETDEDGTFLIREDGKCPLLTADGLCSLQLKYGAEHISDICREHPRFYEWFGGYKEAGVGLCCEEAVRLLLEDNSPLVFESREIDEEDDYLRYDEEVFSALLTARNALLAMLTDRTLPIQERLRRLLFHGQRFQDALDDEDMHQLYTEIDHLNDLSDMHDDLATEYDPEVIAAGIYEYCSDLDMLDPALFNMMRFTFSKGGIADTVRAFDKLHPDKLYIIEHLAVYFLFRYFMKAVRSFEIMEKIKLTVLSVMIIRMMIAAECAPIEDIIREYSAEIEYSAENLGKLYEDFYAETFFSYDGLMSLII